MNSLIFALLKPEMFRNLSKERKIGIEAVKIINIFSRFSENIYFYMKVCTWGFFKEIENIKFHVTSHTAAFVLQNGKELNNKLLRSV